MVSKLYVGNLPFTVSEDQLKDLFSQFGTVESVKIVKEFDGRSKGFGFVEMSSNEEAESASAGLNGKNFEGRDIRVDIARPKESRPREGGRSGGPRGGGDRGGSRGGFRSSSSGSNGDRRNRWS